MTARSICRVCWSMRRATRQASRYSSRCAIRSCFRSCSGGAPSSSNPTHAHAERYRHARDRSRGSCGRRLGAVAGCSIESMSFVHGGFHDTCLEYEVIAATGEVLTCTPDNQHSLIFQMVHGAFGTLGILSKLTFKLIPAKPYVHVVYEKYTT